MIDFRSAIINSLRVHYRGVLITEMCLFMQKSFYYLVSNYTQLYVYNLEIVSMQGVSYR